MLGCVSSLWEFPFDDGMGSFSRQFLRQTHWDGKIVLKLEVRAHHWSLVLTASSTPHDWRKNPPKTPNHHPDPRDKVSVAMATTVNEWVPWPVYRYKNSTGNLCCQSQNRSPCKLGKGPWDLVFFLPEKKNMFHLSHESQTKTPIYSIILVD